MSEQYLGTNIDLGLDIIQGIERKGSGMCRHGEQTMPTELSRDRAH